MSSLARDMYSFSFHRRTIREMWQETEWHLLYMPVYGGEVGDALCILWGLERLWRGTYISPAVLLKGKQSELLDEETY